MGTDKDRMPAGDRYLPAGVLAVGNPARMVRESG
jgi:hypothetical protein